VIDIASLEYAQARLQARHGERPDEAAWRRIEPIRDWPALLEAARSLPFRPWVTGLTAESSIHEIEATLRARGRTLVTEVASWMPREWQPAVLWCRVLGDLPALHYLWLGGTPPAWMRADPVYRDLCQQEPEARRAALSAGSLAPFAGTWDQPGKLLANWRTEWWRRCPHGFGTDGTLVEEVARALSIHAAQFAEAAPAGAWSLRRALHARLIALFRRAALDPAAAFAFLAVAAIDQERLRGELIRRVLFPGRRLAP
jgi:hypothetical protein